VATLTGRLNVRFGAAAARRRNRFAWGLIAPALVILALVVAYPLLYSFKTSLTSLNLSVPGQHFVGLDNYKGVFSDSRFWNSARVTGLFVVVVVSVELVLGFAIATLLARLARARRWVLPAVLLPMMVTPVIMGLMWKYMLSEDFGVVNWFLQQLHLPVKDWLSNTSTALPTLMAIDIWMWTPFMALILLAGMLSLPREPFEAAAMDGASRWMTLRRVTLPLLKKVILVAVLLRAVDALQTFDVVFVTTKGGPGIKTELASFYAYKQGFEFFDMGYALALSWVLVIVTIVVASLYLRMIPEGQKKLV
jgi:multiple sugar transport system permease protein